MTSALHVLRRQRAEQQQQQQRSLRTAADDEREAEAVTTEWQRLYRQHFSATPSPPSPAVSSSHSAAAESGCIPRFYFPPASSASSPSPSLGEQFRLLCRESQLQRVAEQRLEDADIAAVWAALSSGLGEDGSLSRLSSASSSASVTATSLSLSYSALLQSPLDAPLSYSRFLALAAAVPAVKRAAHFNAAAFALLPRLPSAPACVSPRLLLLHLLYSALTARLRVSLLSYASSPAPAACLSSPTASSSPAPCSGWLSEQDLMNYVHDDLQRRQPEGFEPDFLPYYVFAAVRKLLFFLDPGRSGRVQVERLVHCSLMQEWEHRRAGDSQGQQDDGEQQRADSEQRQTPTKEQLAMGRKARDADCDAAAPLRLLRESLVQAAATASAAGELTIGQSALPSALFSCTDPGRLSAGSAASTRPSWFAASNSQAVYALYLSLDTDHNGMLSQAELAAFHGGSFTPALLDALFSSVPLYLSAASSTAPLLEMDYKAFLDLILALEYPHTPSSLRYFFTLLDTERAGRLSRSCVMRWFRAVRCRLQELGHEGVVSEAVLADELWDMVGPERADGLTLRDLVRCRCGHTVVSILTDVNGFWKYDHRETLMAQQQQQQTQQTQPQ